MRFVTSMTASGVALGNVFCAPVIDSCLMDVSLVVAGLLVVPDPPGAAMGLSCAIADEGSHSATETHRPLSKGRTWRVILMWITCANPVAVATSGWGSVAALLRR